MQLTVRQLLPWMRDHILRERPELFMKGDTVYVLNPKFEPPSHRLPDVTSPRPAKHPHGACKVALCMPYTLGTMWAPPQALSPRLEKNFQN